ncbi:unnamed protein product [Ilex paraguariensis]|uniref:Uncharacterized protein n=1 Tax=Ilex paraguariensis TaxID=185542 RepID=A0ABC8SL22_9AQUA
MRIFVYLLSPLALLLIRFSFLIPFRGLTQAPAPYANFQLVETWAPTFCSQPHIPCIQHFPRTFTLHGLWPADANGNTLLRCSTSRRDKDIQTEIRALRSQLRQVWPNIRTDITEDIFWQHEWNEHGICSLTRMTKMNYFQAAIRETRRINLLTILQNARIVPGSHIAYTKNQFENAVRNSIGTYIYVSCARLNNTHVLLKELFICLDDTATRYINCPASTSPRGCPRARGPNIILPS